MTDPIEVRVEKHFRHPPERVFDAFTDPARVGQWLFRTPDGRMEKTDYDPRPGGRFEIVERRGDTLAHHWGEFIVIDRPGARDSGRIVFDFWVEEAKNERTRVTVTFTASGAGCDVVLTHELDAAWAAYADRTSAGWTMILDSLAAVIAASEGDRS